jgi:hypothetical protein
VLISALVIPPWEFVLLLFSQAEKPISITAQSRKTTNHFIIADEFTLIISLLCYLQTADLNY